MARYDSAAFRVCGKAAKHTLFALLIIYFQVALGNVHTPYFTALLIAAWIRYKGDLTVKL